MERTLLKCGDKVTVTKPAKNEAWLESMNEYDGIETTIIGVHGIVGGINKRHYSLAGCISDMNKPFFFMPEWLSKVQ